MPNSITDQALLDAQVEWEIYKRTKERQRILLRKAVRRAARYYTQTQIAQALKCSQPYIHKLLNE